MVPASTAGDLIASVAEWQEELGNTELGTYQYARDTLQHKRDGHLGHLTIDYLRDSGSAVMGDPDSVHRGGEALRGRRAAICCSAS